ncbi:isthmin-1 isoform X2 [Phycodurus eques]|uniref:isthmin-1 isoform X2 n=1 Tax=Phycodurus eques TaxID=693459 RepID=UPI002ACDBA6F|nr:isthmin-1 isoform X2 [Phycodurus eques]
MLQRAIRTGSEPADPHVSFSQSSLFSEKPSRSAISAFFPKWTLDFWGIASIRFPSHLAFLTPEVAPRCCCGSSSPADPEIGASAPGGGGAAATSEAPKGGRVRRMVRLAAELLLLLGLLLLTLHITVLRSSPLPPANVSRSLDPSENIIHAKSSSLGHLAPEGSWRAGAERRFAHRSAALPWVQGTGSNVHKDGPGSFLLDLQNFPDLSKADINGQNPNIQVTIEVVDGLDAHEPEKGHRKENKPNWASPNWRNWWPRTSSSTNQGQEQDRSFGSNNEDSNFLRPPVDWDQRGGTGDRGKPQMEYDYMDGEGDWSNWSLCSVTCGNGSQKRTRSCGYACTATESRTCDTPNCPGIEDAFKTAATEVSLLAGTDHFNATELFGVDTDSCERWMNCKSDFLKKYMTKVVSDLPSCPCSYPTEVAYSTANVHDAPTRRNFRWKDASGPKEKLEIYKPTARYCIRSMLTLESTTLAAQHCCYDDSMKLITRGKGAGTPNLISTEFSADLHYKVDILPWIICKGDWSRYNQARPPNNRQKCHNNPQEEDYYKQFEEAREF